MSYVASLNGYPCADPREEFRYCDLGCGEGVTLLAMAAAYPQSRFIGVDINACYIEAAQGAAQISGLHNVEFIVASFKEFADSKPEKFQYVAAHGILSWVSPEVQDEFRDTVARIISPEDGLLYCGYCVLPGMQESKAMFTYLQNNFDVNDGAILNKLRSGIEDVKKAQSLGFPIFSQRKQINGVILELSNRSDPFLVHEYGNKHFDPKFFSDFRVAFEGVGLNFAGSCQPSKLREYQGDKQDFVTQLNMKITEDLLSILNNDSFRWDLYSSSQPAANNIFESLYICHRYMAQVDIPKNTFTFKRSMSGDAVFDHNLEISRLGNKKVHELYTSAHEQSISKELCVSKVLEMLSALEFQLALHPLTLQSTEKKYRFSHNLASYLWKRDFFLEGQLILPSQILGSAVVLSGDDALLVAMLNESSLCDMEEQAISYAAKLNDQQRITMGITNPSSKRRWQKRVIYLKNCLLPWLIAVDALQEH